MQKQESLDIFICLDQYFRLIQDVSSQLKLAKFVAQVLEKYPSEIKVGNIGWESIAVLDRLAYCYLEAKNYSQAQKIYLETIDSIDLQENLTGVDAQWVKQAQAITYHQLGSVAQDLREYEQAKEYYQQALQIQVEFGARFAYGQLGLLAQELKAYQEAKVNYLKALEIFVAYNDEHYIGVVLRCLEDLYEVTKDEDILSQTASILGTS